MIKYHCIGHFEGGIKIKKANGHLRIVNGYINMRITWTDANGKPDSRQISTGLKPSYEQQAKKMLKKAKEIFDMDFPDESRLAIKDAVKKGVFLTGEEIIINRIAPIDSTKLLEVRLKELSKHTPIVDALRTWIEYKKMDVESGKTRKRTLNDYIVYIDNVLEPYFEAQKIAFTLDSLTGTDLDVFYDFLRKNGHKDSTIKHYVTCLNQTYKMAIRRGVRITNSVEASNTPTVSNKKKLKAEYTPSIDYQNIDLSKELQLADLQTSAPQIEQLNEILEHGGREIPEDELSIIMEKALEDEILAVPIYSALTYALRPGEAAALNYPAIDFKNRIIRLDHTIEMYSDHVAKKSVLEYVPVMKTNSSFASFYLDELLEELILESFERKKKNIEFFGDTYNKKYLEVITVQPNGDLPRLDYISKRFKKLCIALGFYGYTARDLRHTMATRIYVETGGDINAVKEYLRHTNVKTTKSYVHRQINNTAKPIAMDIIRKTLKNITN